MPAKLSCLAVPRKHRAPIGAPPPLTGWKIGRTRTRMRRAHELGLHGNGTRQRAPRFRAPGSLDAHRGLSGPHAEEVRRRPQKRVHARLDALWPVPNRLEAWGRRRSLGPCFETHRSASAAMLLSMRFGDKYEVRKITGTVGLAANPNSRQWSHLARIGCRLAEQSQRRKAQR